MKFCERLKMIRSECGLTQRQVYEILNISPNGYASYEQGRTEPNIDTLKIEHNFFKVSIFGSVRPCS